MSDIPSWRDRCEKHPDHQTGMVSHGMIRARMQEEIDDLRVALSERDALRADAERWRFIRDADEPTVCRYEDGEWMPVHPLEIVAVVDKARGASDE